MHATSVDTILHAERLVHHFFGEIDLLAILEPQALPLSAGARGIARLADGRDIAIRVKSVWSKEPDDTFSGKVLIVAPLAVPPAEVCGCAIEWHETGR